MKKFFSTLLLAVLASVGVAQAETVTVWSEDFSGNSLDDYSVVGTTKIYNENLALGAAAPELLISKNSGAFVVNLTDLKGAKGDLTLTYVSNKYGLVVVTSTTDGVTVGEQTYTGEAAPYAHTVTVSLPEGATSLNLTFTNTSSKNARYDDFVLVGSTDGEVTPAELTAPVISGVEKGQTYESATVKISYPAAATSMTWSIMKDGAEVYGGTATAAVSQEVTEEGNYTVAASATDGTNVLKTDTIAFSIVKPIDPATLYEALDPANVKEGYYIIVGENEGKYYLMKNATLGTNYVDATEWEFSDAEDAKANFSQDNIFYVCPNAEKGGYDITALEDETYVTIEETTNGTKTYQNLRVGQESADATWSFTDNNGVTDAKYGDFSNFMSFYWYAKSSTPEFTTGSKDTHIRPVFYLLEEESDENYPSVHLSFDHQNADGTYDCPVTVSATFPEAATSGYVVVKKDEMQIAKIDGLADWTETYSEEGAYVVTATAVVNGAEYEDEVEFEIVEPEQLATYKIVTSADQLAEGAKVIFVSDVNAMSNVQNTKNVEKQYREYTTVTVDGTTASAGNAVAVFTVGKDGENFTFYNDETVTEEGVEMPGYLCAYSSEKNSVSVETVLDDNGKWSLSFDGSNVVALAQGDLTRNQLMYNFNGFRCYDPATTSITNTLQIYVDEYASVSNLAADGVKVVAEEGAVRISADSAVEATVYTAAGALVAAKTVNGEATISLAPGFYVVRAGQSVAKVIVK